MLEEKFLVKDLNELAEFCSDRLGALVRDLPSSNLVILFFAEMGAGKTTLIREFGKVLGIKENITSPTFVGMNEYHLDDLSFYHFDLYQVSTSLENLAELFANNTRNILVIEWAEKLDGILLEYLRKNSTVLTIQIKINKDESRSLSLSQG